MVLAQSLSGVRGVYGIDLTLAIVRRYAIEYESFLREKKGFTPTIVIGYDTRPSSKIIKSTIEDNIGARIIDLGVATTPLIQNTVRLRNADGGIIITASHNPPEYNGFKFLREDGALLNPEDMDKLIRRVKDVDPVNEYINFVFGLTGEESLAKIADYYAKGNGRRVIVDPNGGSACVVLEDVLERLDIEYDIVNGDLGNFGREIEPNKDTLVGLVNRLQKEGDIAFGFDCDADRVEVVISSGSGYVKEFGNVVSGQYLFGVIVEHILNKLGKNAKGEKIVVNDAASYLIREIAEKYGTEVVEVGTGEVNVVNKMIEVYAIMAGEPSSSGFIHREARCRDGILTMFYILAAVAEREKPLGEIIDKELPKYYTLRDDDQYCDPDSIEQVKAHIIDHYTKKGYRISIPDEFSGIKAIDKQNNWVWFRASATKQGQLRIFADSKNKKKAESLLEEGKKVLQEAA